MKKYLQEKMPSPQKCKLMKMPWGKMKEQFITFNVFKIDLADDVIRA